MPVVRPLVALTNSEVKELVREKGALLLVVRDDGTYIDNRSVVVKIDYTDETTIDVMLIACENDAALIYTSENEGVIELNSYCDADLLQPCENLANAWCDYLGFSYGGYSTVEHERTVSYCSSY